MWVVITSEASQLLATCLAEIHMYCTHFWKAVSVLCIAQRTPKVSPKMIMCWKKISQTPALSQMYISINRVVAAPLRL